MTDSPHLTALKKHNRLGQLAKKRIRIVGGKLEITAANHPAIDLEAAAATERHGNLRPGNMIAGSGIYFGTWEPKDEKGKSLGKVFNMFAAPEDFSRGSHYPAALRKLATLENWNGHDGTRYAHDKEIYAALKDGSYDGGWFIPPVEILYGRDAQEHAAADNLYKHKDKGALKGTFKNAAGAYGKFSFWYGSSTPDKNQTGNILAINFFQGTRSTINYTSSAMVPGIRLVRLEPKS